MHVNDIGDIYDGEFQFGKKHGLGTLKITKMPIALTYLGEFKNDQYDGQGQLKIDPITLS